MIKKYLDKAFKDRVEERNTKVTPTPGHYRVGNVGIIMTDGNTWGCCHRQTMARTLGLTKDSDIMNPYFEVGFANEAYVASILPPKTEDYDEIVFEPGWELTLKVGDITIAGFKKPL